ncbi:MAG: hypothetical protein ACHQT7_01680 [Candidatus Levyibacteriota bacterium]
MIFLISLIILLLISFFWALMNLSKEIEKPKHLKKIRDSLQKEKILFKR